VVHTPSSEGLKKAVETSYWGGLVIIVLTAAWEWATKLWEHIILTWIAEHLHEQPVIQGIVTWTIENRILSIVIVAVGFCLFVIGKAMIADVRQKRKPAAPAASAQGEPEPPPPQPKPHFEFLGPAMRYLYFSHDPREGVREPATRNQEDAEVWAITLRFTNLAKGALSLDAMNVFSRMRIYDETWMHSVDVDYGVWIGSAAECTDMDVGSVRELLLIVYGDHNSYYTFRDMRHGGRFEISEDITYVREINVDWITNVEVILTDQRSHTSEGWIFRIEPHPRSCVHHAVSPPAQAARMPR
jgi:hypothetical protein